MPIRFPTEAANADFLNEEPADRHDAAGERAPPPQNSDETPSQQQARGRAARQRPARNADDKTGAEQDKNKDADKP